MSERTAPKTHYVTCTIAAGASLSGEVDGRGMRLAKIFMPSAWTAAGISFTEAEASAGTFNPLYDDSGLEIAVTAAASTTIAISTNAIPLTGVGYLKVRSGTSASAVNQDDARVIGLLFVG